MGCLRIRMEAICHESVRGSSTGASWRDAFDLREFVAEIVWEQPLPSAHGVSSYDLMGLTVFRISSRNLVMDRAF